MSALDKVSAEPRGDDDPTHYRDNTIAHVLDDVVNQSLANAHRRFARRKGRIARYHPDVAGFIGQPADMAAHDWYDLATLLPSGSEFTLRNLAATPGPGFSVVASHLAVQLTGELLQCAHRGDIVALTARDVPAMLELVGLTRPGPFLERTIELGTYLGIRHHGHLVAMAGERLQPPGWGEISAVCVHPDHRKRGHAAALVAAIGLAIREDGRIPFLHAAAGNLNAIRLYERLGFTHRRTVSLTRLRTD